MAVNTGALFLCLTLLFHFSAPHRAPKDYQDAIKIWHEFLHSDEISSSDILSSNLSQHLLGDGHSLQALSGWQLLLKGAEGILQKEGNDLSKNTNNCSLDILQTASALGKPGQDWAMQSKIDSILFQLVLSPSSYYFCIFMDSIEISLSSPLPVNQILL